MSVNKKTAAKIAENLLAIQAVKLSPSKPFTWASGWKSPIYCDNRVSLSHPEFRSYIRKKLAEAILENFGDVDAIVGVATAGIAPGALVADKLKLPFAYIRPEPKSHGRQNLLEGDLDKGMKVVVVEDLISTGGSSLKAVEELRKLNFKVVGLASIFTYAFDVADKNFKNAKCKYFSLSNYPALIDTALSKGYIKNDQIDTLNAWRKDPSKWGV